MSNPTVRYMCSTGRTPLPNEPISLFIWKTGVAFGSKGMVFSMSPDRAPTSPAG